jgi:H+/Cl- antiporter ClcA
VVPAAAIVGLLAATVVLTFRWVIDLGQATFLPAGQVGDYEALPPLLRFPLPIAGALLLAMIMARLPATVRSVGVGHVLRKLQEDGRVRLPQANMAVQFLAGSLAIISGQSLDREGPGVHLGAAAGNWLAFHRWLTDEEIRTLTVAGAAASIAAAFNTPLAGVVFVLEVLLVRYEVVRIVAIMIASVVGALVGRLVYGADPAFLVPTLSMTNHWELGLVLILGLGMGILASSMIAGCAWISRHTAGWPLWISFGLAGSCTAFLGLFTPEILGISYSTISDLMVNEVTVAMLLGLVAFKLIATTVSVGVGMPGGLIGPTLVIGGAAGALGGEIAALISPETATSVGFYAMVGMAAMMGTTLRAPLAALMALVEQTSDPHILFPGMLAVATAEIVAWGLVGRDSVFARLLARDGPVHFTRR